MGLRGPSVVLLLVMILLSSVILLPEGGLGQGVDETQVDEWVETRYDIAFEAFDHIRVTARFDLYEADLDLGYGIPASTLREKAGTDPGLLTSLEDTFRSELLDTVKRTMDSLDIDNATTVVTGPTSVALGENVTGDPYKEPLTFEGTVDLYLGPEALGLPIESDLDDLVSGTLKMGGVLNLSFGLFAKAGHLNLFVFTPPASIVFLAGQAKTTVQELPVDARDGTTDVSVKRYLVFAHGSPARLDEDMSASAHLDMVDLDVLRVTIDISIRAVDASRISPYFPDVLGMPIISADGIRMAVANGLLGWDDIYDLAVRDEVERIEDLLGDITGSAVKLDLEWVDGSLVGHNVSDMTGGPVSARLTANGSMDLQGMSVEVAKAALDSGARVLLEVDLDLDLDWKVGIVLPQGVTLEGTGLTPSTGTDGRVRFDWGKGWGKVSGSLVSTDPFMVEDLGEIHLGIKVKDADSDIARVLGDRRTTVYFKMDIVVRISALRVEDGFEGQLPEGVGLEVVSADLIRTLLAHGDVNRSRLDDALLDITPEVSRRVSSAVGAEVDLRMYIEERTLDINATGPIEVRGAAKVDKKKDIDSLDQVVNVIDVGQRFPLEGKRDWKVTYAIQFPEGVEIIDVKRDDRNVSFVGTSSVSGDRRTYTEVLVDEGTDNVTIHVRPTLGLTVSEALPQPICFMPIILFIVAIIGLTYWFRRRSRMKGLPKGKKKKRKGPSMDEYEKVPARVKRPPRRRPSRKGAARPGPRVEKGRKAVKCPDCGRRFTVDPRYRDIVCPHCGRKGKLPVKKSYKRVQCPKCKHIIRYRKGETVIKCSNCGKEGRVKG